MAEAKDAAKPRVLIVGGSISGLFLAVALQSANIDFLVLERGPVIGPQLGASIGCHPHGNSIFDQIGLWDRVLSYAIPLTQAKVFDGTGRVWENNITVVRDHTQRYGYPVIFIQRCNFISVLYEQIRDKSKVLVNKGIVDYKESEGTVKVFAQDGTTYEGAILVGADGINSTIRGLMKKKAEERHLGSGVKLETTNNGDLYFECLVPDTYLNIGKPGFFTEYRCLFAISRTNERECPMPPGQIYWAYDRDVATTAAAGEPGLFFWFLWERVDPVQTVRSPRFIEEDAEAIIRKYATRKMCADWTVQDAWKARVRGALVSQEEGILDQWNAGRAVLIGDAVHKMGINAGLGAMSASEGIVHLVNLLYPVMSPDSPNEQRLTDELCNEIFSTYRENHLKRLKTITEFSATAVRFETHRTWLIRLFAKYILPWCSNFGRLIFAKPIFGGQPMFSHLPKDMSKPINQIVQ